MSAFLNPVQQAIYTRLNGNVSINLGAGAISVTVYDDVPDLPAKMPEADFPYIHIGEDLDVPWDTDDTLGASTTATLYVWSRYSGKREVKAIMSEIYDLLNRQKDNLSASGFRFVDCLHEFAQVLDMSDGKTRQGICRYRVTLEKE